MRRLPEYLMYGVVCVLLLAPVSPAPTSELVWTPINPSFVGGHYLNASWLMATAEAQNRHVEKFSSARPTRQDPFADFEYSLKRQYIYELSRKIIDEAFGEEGLLPPGEAETQYVIGDFVIDITSDGQLSVVITDTSTGNTTVVELPYF